MTCTYHTHLRKVIQKAVLGGAVGAGLVLGHVSLVIYLELLLNQGVGKDPQQLLGHIPDVRTTCCVGVSLQKGKLHSASRISVIAQHHVQACRPKTGR